MLRLGRWTMWLDGGWRDCGSCLASRGPCTRFLSIRVVAEAGLVDLVCNDIGGGSMATWLKKEIEVGGRREIIVDVLTRKRN